MPGRLHGTTVLAVAREGRTVVAGDGQVSMGQTVVKGRAVKVRRIYGDRVLAGFAGSTADAFSLFTRFEAKLEEFRGNLTRSAVELAKEWRTDRALRRLEALLIVADPARMLLVSGTGDIVEPDDGVLGIGSGGPFAVAAARALLRHTPLGAREIAVEALGVAASICVYTNAHLTVEEIGGA